MPLDKHPLFDFINIFSKNEVRQFVKFANLDSKKEESKHLKLFKAIHQMDTYSELKALKAASYSSRTAFLKGRIHLTDLLHRFLRHLEGRKSKKDKSKLMIVNEAITDVLLLRERGESDLAFDCLLGAMEVAREHNLDSQMLILLQLQKSFLRQGIGQKQEGTIETVNQTITELLEQLRIANKITNYYDQLFAQKYKIDIAYQQVLLKQAMQAFEEEEIVIEDLGVKTFMAYYSIRAKYFQLVEKDKEQLATQWKQMLDFLESRPAFKSEDQERFLNIYYNYCGSLIKLNRFDKATLEQCLDTIQAIKPKNINIQNKIKQHLCYYQLQYYFLQDDYKGILDLKKEVEAIVEQAGQHSLSPYGKLIFKYHLAVAHFHAATLVDEKEHSAELYEAQSIALEIDLLEQESRTEMQLKTKLLLASIAYIQDADTLFDTYYNAIRYLCRDTAIDKAFGTGKAILFTLNKARNAPEREQKNYFQKLLDGMDEQSRYHYRAFILWLELQAK